MKNNKFLLVFLFAIVMLVMTLIFAFSQNAGSLPLAAVSFSVFNQPQNLSMPLNSAEVENAPFLAPNGLSLYLSGDGRTGGFGSGDVYVSQRPTLTSAWGTPQNLGSVINGPSNDNTPSLSPDGLALFFTSDKPGGFGGQDMYFSTRTDPNNDFSWSNPINMGAVLNTPLNEGGQILFVDPNSGVVTLYFLAIRAGGLGSYDIYQSIRNTDGSWNEPTNVTPLNSTERDARPSIRSDGLEMFFYSERDGGPGNPKIFVSTRASILAQWNPPVSVNIVNAGGALAPALSPDGTILYFVSGRVGGFGSVDIYIAIRGKASCIRPSTLPVAE